jgi:hypothetical protein
MGLPLIAVSCAALAAAFAALATGLAIASVLWSQRTLAASRRRSDELLASISASESEGPRSS